MESETKIRNIPIGNGTERDGSSAGLSGVQETIKAESIKKVASKSTPRKKIRPTRISHPLLHKSGQPSIIATLFRLRRNIERVNQIIGETEDDESVTYELEDNDYERLKRTVASRRGLQHMGS